jgi:hypothetical protein
MSEHNEGALTTENTESTEKKGGDSKLGFLLRDLCALCGELS